MKLARYSELGHFYFFLNGTSKCTPGAKASSELNYVVYIVFAFAFEFCAFFCIFQMKQLDLQKRNSVMERQKCQKIKKPVLVMVTRSSNKCYCVNTVAISAAFGRSF